MRVRQRQAQIERYSESSIAFLRTLIEAKAPDSTVGGREVVSERDRERCRERERQK